VEGSEKLYPHTGVIISVSQGSENGLVTTTTGIDTDHKGLLTVDGDGHTTRPGIFAAGDAVKGARTVVEAVAMAKEVAAAMDQYMKSLPADTTPDPYADIPVDTTPVSDAIGEQKI
jgi:glutamate synthase (NADPH/NADH) small chain